jgi:hypothetical protein
MADLFVRDLMGGPLMNDVADRDEEGSAEGEQGGGIRLRHRRPPEVVSRKGLGKWIVKACARGAATCFNSVRER